MRLLAPLAALGLLSSFAPRADGQAFPGPTVDRVGFPADYKSTFTRLLTVDRPDNGQIRVIWGNALATRTNWWESYPYGSVLLFESWTSRRNADNSLIYDENGRLIPDTLGTIFVKRKGEGFGADYRDVRNGEWEYVAYRPDGSVQTTPQNSGACAACHLQGGTTRDWTFRRQAFGTRLGGGVPTFTMSQYAFYPGAVTVKKGTTVIWRNDDDIDHTVFVTDVGSFSGTMDNSATFAQKFDEEGTFTIRCSIHAGMRATVTVVK